MDPLPCPLCGQPPWQEPVPADSDSGWLLMLLAIAAGIGLVGGVLQGLGY